MADLKYSSSQLLHPEDLIIDSFSKDYYIPSYNELTDYYADKFDL